jgi:general secretion pathway protein L
MSLLRIYCPLREPPLRCQWTLLGGGEPVSAEGPLAQLPRHAERVQLVIPAAQVLLTRVRLPNAARRLSGTMLAFAAEEEIAGEPDTNQVSWLGPAGDADAVAVVDRDSLKRWLDALDGIGIGTREVHCETLLLPWTTGEWSLAWDGREGYVRTGELEGGATDCGDRGEPPMSLRLMLEEAQARGTRPPTIAVFTTAPDAAPDVESWQRELHVIVRPAGAWDWRTAPQRAGVSLLRHRQRWSGFSGLLPRLRPAAWIAGAALVIHAAALVTDWALLASERRTLLQRMEERFRTVFPDAVAVVDPALQMRRKLADARHIAGLSDGGDFLPMIEKAAAGLRELPAGSLRTVSYENGRLTLELAALGEPAVRRIVARLQQAGLGVDRGIETAAAAAPSGSRSVIITARPL